MLGSLTLRSFNDRILENNEDMNFEKVIDTIKFKDINYLMSFSLLSRSNILTQTKEFKFYDKICYAIS